MTSGPKPRLALDTNVLFDLADGKEFASTILEVLMEKNITVHIPPTVLIELEHEICDPASPLKGRRAEQSFDCIRRWKMVPILLDEVQMGIAKEFYKALVLASLLPVAETHDGDILAEAALGGAEYLLTSDKHLLQMDREKLHAVFAKQSLHPVQVVPPRAFYTRVRHM